MQVGEEDGLRLGVGAGHGETGWWLDRVDGAALGTDYSVNNGSMKS